MGCSGFWRRTGVVRSKRKNSEAAEVWRRWFLLNFSALVNGSRIASEQQA